MVNRNYIGQDFRSSGLGSPNPDLYQLNRTPQSEIKRVSHRSSVWAADEARIHAGGPRKERSVPWRSAIVVHECFATTRYARVGRVFRGVVVVGEPPVKPGLPCERHDGHVVRSTLVSAKATRVERLATAGCPARRRCRGSAGGRTCWPRGLLPTTPSDTMTSATRAGRASTDGELGAALHAQEHGAPVYRLGRAGRSTEFWRRYPWPIDEGTSVIRRR